MMMKKRKRIIHIAVHMGGGAGKAIAGLICGADQMEWLHTVVLLEQPADTHHVDICKENGIDVILAETADKKRLTTLFQEADAIVINWWGHPLMPQFLIEHLSGVKGRILFWFHINGCSYPYIPYELAANGAEALFTTAYSLENPLWSRAERNQIRGTSTVIYGMGDFFPETILPKVDYHTDKLRIGYVGTVSYSKMNHRMLDYIEMLHQHIPRMEVTLAGECDAEIRNEVRKRQLEGIVRCTGKIEDIYSYYRSFDIFLYLLTPDCYGTTENVLLEAMAVGLPIIVLNNPVERNIIRNGENGYIVDREEELLNLVTELHSDTTMRQAAGSRARAYVCREYDACINRQRYLDVLLSVLEKPKTCYPFQDVMGASPYEWFRRFTGKNQTNFLRLCAGEGGFDQELNIWVDELAPIYTGTHKSSISHFLEYYPDDKQLRKISSEIEMIKEWGQRYGGYHSKWNDRRSKGASGGKPASERPVSVADISGVWLQFQV